MNNQGWIKLHRELLEWEWYRDTKVKAVFIHCLIKANFKCKKWKGIEIKRGSFITSYDNLSDEIGLSVQNVRTAIKKLEKTGELTRNSTNRFTLLTVNNYETYQSEDETTNKLTNNRSTIHQQTSNNQLTTTKNEKKEKNVKNEKEPSYTFDEFLKDYGKTPGSRKARKLWNSLTEESIQVIKSFLPGYKLAYQDPEYRKNIDNFIVSEIWLEDPTRYQPKSETLLTYDELLLEVTRYNTMDNYECVNPDSEKKNRRWKRKHNAYSQSA